MALPIVRYLFGGLNAFFFGDVHDLAVLELERQDAPKLLLREHLHQADGGVIGATHLLASVLPCSTRRCSSAGSIRIRLPSLTARSLPAFLPSRRPPRL